MYYEHSLSIIIAEIKISSSYTPICMFNCPKIAPALTFDSYVTANQFIT